MAVVANLAGTDQEEKDKTGEPGSEVPSTGASSASVSSPLVQTAAGPQPQGSGRFTNVGKYLQANVGAGQQIGSKVQGGINRDLGKQVKQAGTQAEAMRQGIESAKTSLGQGAGYLGQVGGDVSEFQKYLGTLPAQPAPVQPQAPAPQEPAPAQPPSPLLNIIGTREDAPLEGVYGTSAPSGGTVSAQKMTTQGQLPEVKKPPKGVSGPGLTGAEGKESFYQTLTGLASDPEQLAKFTGFRTGATQAELAKQLSAGAQSAQESAKAANERLLARQGQLKDVSSRYGLLGEFVGQKNAYNKGAQQLDQLFLQRDKANTLGKLAQNLAEQKAGTFKGLTETARTLGEQGTEAQKYGTQLASALTGQTQKNIEQQIADIEGQVGNVNAARAAEQERYKQFFRQLTGKEPTAGDLDSELFKEFQLREGQQTFNVLNDPNLTLEQIANISQQQAGSYKDIATQKDVDLHKFLAQLAGTTTDRLTKAGELEKAAAAKTGEGSLAGRLTTAQKEFLDKALATTLTGSGSESYRDDWGKGGESTMYATQNIGELLRNVGYNADRGSSGESDQGNPFGTAANMLPFDPGGGVSGLLRDAGLTVPSLGEAVSNVTGGIGRAIFGGGGSAGAERAAAVRAKENLMAQINAYMRQSGFGNILTGRGVKDTSDIQEQLTGNTQQLYQAENALKNINRAGFMGGTMGEQVPLTATSTPEDVEKAARAGVPKTQMVVSPSSEAGFAFRELSPQEQEAAYQDNLRRYQAAIDQVKQLQGQRSQYTTNLQNLLGPAKINPITGYGNATVQSKAKQGNV